MPGRHGRLGGDPAAAPPAQLHHNADIAAFAKRYEHKVPYVWGGYLPSGWDCSGMVNYVLGHHFGMMLPGGYRWTGRSHGPTAAMYKVWGKAHNVATAEAGDLCVWLTHIGFAVGPAHYISAFDTQLGTVIEPIHGGGPRGEKVTIRRINMVGATVPGPVRQAAGCTPSLILMPYLITKGLVTGARHRGQADH